MTGSDSSPLLGWWKLCGDARDSSGRENHGRVSGVDFSAPGRRGEPARARFNGCDASIEIPHNPSLQLGEQEFTIGAWIRLNPHHTGALGDIACKFDGRRRRGFNLCLLGTGSGYNSQGDMRRLFFGIDNGMESPWEDHGRLAPSNTYVTPLTVFDGGLYCGMGDVIGERSEACRVFRFAGGQTWEDCGRVAESLLMPTSQALTVHDGALYAATGRQDRLALLKEPSDPARVYLYDGVGKWIDCGQPGENRRVLSLASFNGDLYCGTDNDVQRDHPQAGKVFRYAGGKEWIDCGRCGVQTRIFCFAAHHGRLYVGAEMEVHRYEGGQEWTYLGRPRGCTQVHCLKVFTGRLYAGTWPQGYVCRHEGGTEWSVCGTLGQVERTDPGKKEGPLNEVQELLPYNGMLYAGAIPKAEVYRHDGEGQWTVMRRLVSAPDWSPYEFDSWSRVPTMSVYQGRLFAATGLCRGFPQPNPHFEYGRIYSTMCGQAVSHDRDVAPGWSHVAAVRRADSIELYLNGQLAEKSLPFPGRCYDLSNREPLRIGIGATDFFSGDMEDVRLYGKALDGSEIQSLLGS